MAPGIRQFEVFVVSGDSVNFSRTLRSILAVDIYRAGKVSVYADWPVEEVDRDLWPSFNYIPQEKPFVVVRENNRALKDIWGRGRDAVLVEDDVVLETPGLLAKLSQFAAAFGGKALLSPAVKGFKYDNVCLEPSPYTFLRREPYHFPIIVGYFPVELEFLIGYYDERYTAYGCDDNDYSLRLYRAGIPMLVASQVVASHLYDESVFKARGRDQTESRAKFKAKWGAFPADPKLF